MDASLHDIISDPNDVMSESSPIKLCGSFGRELIVNIKQDKFANQIEMCKALFKYFSVFYLFIIASYMSGITNCGIFST